MECLSLGRRIHQVRWSLLLVGLVACSKSQVAPAPVASSSAPVVASAPPPPAPVADAGAAPTWPLPIPSLPAAAPVAVDGYPRPLRTCLPDPAFLAGFTADGNELGYCMHGMGTRCELMDRSGAFRRDGAGGPDPKPGDREREAELEKSMTALLPSLKKKDCEYFPNPMTGNFRYGDIKLKVMTVEGSVVKVGGAVGGDPPVFPFVYARPSKGEYSNGTELNVLSLSPDEKEIGLITHSNCMEWCDEFEIVRMSVERFASHVYNDAGYRAYKANDLPKARDLFLRAAYLDDSYDLAAYNLACTYARENDGAHAELALGLAIARGGDAVKKRARTDKDFSAFKDSAWFTTRTAP